MNPTIRQRSAYVSRRTLSHARSEEKLEEHLEVLRCHYNFVRPHGALKFGRKNRTPAMQAGRATRRLTFREVFVCLPPSLLISIGAISCAVPGRLPRAPIEVGSEADIVIWDPTMKKTIRDQDQFSNVSYSTYAGWEVTGFPRTTIRRGEVVYDNGQVIAQPGSGKFIPGAPFQRPHLRETSNRE